MPVFSLKDIFFLHSPQQNVLTDGRLTYSWQDILERLNDLSNFFSQQQINIGDCLALECENSLSSALTLLFLLDKGYNFFLLPQSNQPSFVPSFCRYCLTPNLERTDDFNNFEHWLKITENKQCQPINNGERNLYLRTSGSTGTPKIAVHSQSKLLENVLNCVKRLTLRGDDRVAIPVPIYHMYGLGAAFLPSVVAGASIDLQKGANLLRYLQREKDFNPNVAFMTPSFCETLVKGRKSARDYRLTIVAGDRLKEDIFVRYEEKLGCLVKLYGSTEMGAITAGSPSEEKDLRCQTVGLPMPGVKLRVANPSFDLEKTGVGEICCQHPAGFEGYVDINGKPIIPINSDGWLATKDLGKLRLDGCLEVYGRGDRSVNRDGFLVLFADIEKNMEKMAGIDTIVVKSFGETQRGKGLVAFCVLAKGCHLSENEIRTLCFDVLPQRAIPDQVFILSTLPMLPNGKIDRQKLISFLPRNF